MNVYEGILVAGSKFENPGISSFRYPDDILIRSLSYRQGMVDVECTVSCLQEDGFIINKEKRCF